MSTEAVMDLTLDTRTTLPEDFSCDCQILILSSNLTKLPEYFLHGNKYVKKLDMSKCTNITIIHRFFCIQSCIEHIIWPPNIETISGCCLLDNKCILKIDLSHCTQLTTIESAFCNNTNITDIILPVSIQTITSYFLYNNKTLIHLSLSYCIHLTHIGYRFCSDTNIQSITFPKSLKTISYSVCESLHLQELDFSECQYIDLYIIIMCIAETIKIYSIDNINKTYKVHCKNLHVFNITKTKYLDLSFINDLQNVYLPTGEYCILNSQSKDYSDVNFWLGDSMVSAKTFTNMQIHIQSHLPISKLAMLDIQLDTV
jgi:hypothetical protein